MLSVYPPPPPPINFRTAEAIFMKLCNYTMATEPTSTAYFINLSHQSVCLYVYSLIVARERLFKNLPIVVMQRLGKKKVTAAANTHKSRIVGRVVFYAIRVLSRKVGD
jgi:hypothetical protein